MPKLGLKPVAVRPPDRTLESKWESWEMSGRRLWSTQFPPQPAWVGLSAPLRLQQKIDKVAEIITLTLSSWVQTLKKWRGESAWWQVETAILWSREDRLMVAWECWERLSKNKHDDGNFASHTQCGLTLVWIAVIVEVHMTHDGPLRTVSGSRI